MITNTRVGAVLPNDFEASLLDRPRTEMRRAESVNGSYAKVCSKIVTRRNAEIAVDYRLLLRDGRWRAYDVLVDGVSFVATFRSAFGRIIQQSSYAGLVDTLRRRAVQTTDLERTATAR